MHRMIPKSTLAVVCAIALTTATHNAGAGNFWNVLKHAANQALQQAAQHAPAQPARQPGPATPTPGRPPAAAQSPNSLSSAAGRIAPPAGTKIDVQILSPLQQGAKFFVSPHGMHVATYETSGSRAVIYYDGVEGPPFDEILGSGDNAAVNQPSVAFSPDGKRYAYCGRIGEQFVVMVDGHELARSSESEQGRLSGYSCQIGFTSNSRHVYFTTQATTNDPGERQYIRFVFDGHSAPISGGGQLQPAFSPDGNHYAFVVTDPANQDKWGLVIDGKMASYRGGDPQWSADSKHLYTLLRVPGPGGRCCEEEALRDGRPFLHAENIVLHVPPAGNRVVAELTDRVMPQGAVQFLAIGGRKVPGSEFTVNHGNMDEFVFSPDGRHYAARFTDTDNQQYVFVDGRREREYQTVDNIAFTADSSTVVYTAYTNGKQFVVYGDRESNPCSAAPQNPAKSASPIEFAPVGHGAAAVCEGPMGQATLFLNGKTVPVAALSANKLRFSPDGENYAYEGQDDNRVPRLFLDNVVQPDSNLGPADNILGDQYVFSPDGKHIARYSWSPSSPSTYVRGVFIDGKYLPVAQIPYLYRLGFTADSRHLAWAVPLRSADGYRVYIDGRAVLETAGAINGNSQTPWWDMAPDGTLNVLGQTNTSLVRIHIIPSPSTSIATLLAAAH